MKVPDPKTWVDGEIVGASDLNTEIRDAINFMINKPFANVYSLVDQDIPNQAFTVLQWNQTAEDNDGMYSNVYPSRLTVNTPGIWLVNLSLWINADPNGERQARILCSGREAARIGYASNPGHAFYTTFSTMCRAQVGDYFEADVYQTSGSTLQARGDTRYGITASWIGQ